MINASRDTTTGLRFEERVVLKKRGIDLTKHKLYYFLNEQGIKWETIISKKLLPDAAFFNPKTKEFVVYEKKFQKVNGSADEKPQTCAFKISQFKKIAKSFGATSVQYIYIFNDWFKKPQYKDMLDYIKSVAGCSYFFEEEIGGIE